MARFQGRDNQNIILIVRRIMDTNQCMNYNIVGREKEILELESLLQTDKSEFVAVYGRRRVGKSYLIDEIYGSNMAFRTVGIFVKNEKLTEENYRQEQLLHFYESLLDYGLPVTEPRPTSWLEAFRLLKHLLLKKRSKRKVVFLDELPWLAGPQSADFIAELGFFWNSFASIQKNIVLVVCGSATSWMLDNVIREYGGLHGRLTSKMHVSPFTLRECESYYKKHQFHLSRYEMVIAYMAFGGIPYYLDMLRKERTLTENLDELFFRKSKARQEFEDVYVGLFNSKENYLGIVRALGRQIYGMTRSEISVAIGQKSGGGLSKMLDNLEESDIIRTYTRYGGPQKETVYQLVDFFSMFYLRHIEQVSNVQSGWKALQRSPQFFSWAGLTFELVAMIHQRQLAKALGIGTLSGCYSWKGVSPAGVGAQIDLVMEWKGERTDYLVEIKFSENIYAIDAEYEQKLRNKVDAYIHSKKHIRSHSVNLVLLTTMGLSRGMHNAPVDTQLTMDELFK